MISGVTNIHLLHRAKKNAAENADDGGSSPEGTLSRRQEPESPPDQPEPVPVLSLLLPQGLELELSPSETELQLLGDEECEDEPPRSKYTSQECRLSFFFLLLVLSGVGNILAAKMQAVSMYNYPVFLSLLSYVVYVPLCFAFIIPVSRYGWFNNAIPPSHMALPLRPFAVMGFLDALGGLLQVFASIYLPGSLLVLLPQASIPLSMLLTKHMLGTRYRSAQYIGAAVVLIGVLLVLEPVITYRHAPDYLCEAIDLKSHCTVCSGATTKETCIQLEPPDSGAWPLEIQRNASLALLLSPSLKQSASRIMLETDDSTDVDPADSAICEWVPLSEASTGKEASVFIWSIVMVLSCIPTTLSSVYKQIKLRAHGDLHPIFLIGWIGVFQFLFTAVSAPSLGLATGIPVGQLPLNLWDGLKCYLGVSSVDLGCHPDSWCSSGHAFLFVNLCMACQALYILSTVLVLKYGSTSLLYLGMTVSVPMTQLVFSLPFIRADTSLYISDVIALLVIVLGLVLYRFGHKLPRRRRQQMQQEHPEPESDEVVAEEEEEDPAELGHPLLEPLVSYAYV